MSRRFRGTYCLHLQVSLILKIICIISKITKNHEMLIGLLTYSMVQIILEKLTGLQLVKKFPAFHGTPQGSLPHSQASATCLYPGPNQSSPYIHIPPPRDPSYYYKSFSSSLFNLLHSPVTSSLLGPNNVYRLRGENYCTILSVIV